jgi:transposase
VQVTVDPELEEAMAAVDAHPKSRSRLIRDLALRGAEATMEERRRREEAKEFFRKVADGEIDYDFDALEEVLRERDEMLCKQPPK